MKVLSLKHVIKEFTNLSGGKIDKTLHGKVCVWCGVNVRFDPTQETLEDDVGEG